MAAVSNRRDRRLDGFLDWKSGGVAVKALQVLPFRLPLLPLLVGGTPLFEFLAEPFMVVGHSAEALVASQGEQGVDMVDIGRPRERWRTSGACSEGFELLE